MSGANSDIQFYIFGRHGVLFHPATGKLWVLNPTAATIWCLLPESRDADGLAGSLAERFRIGLAQAGRDVESCLAYFTREGLLAGGQPAGPVRENLLDIHLEDTQWREPAYWAFESYLRVPGAAIRFTSDDRLAGEQFMGFLHHLEADGVLPRVDARMALVRAEIGDGWSVFLDGKQYVSGVAAAAVLPHLYSLLLVCATWGLEKYFLLHGAVLELNGKVLLLPGVAKSGKTTLTAILAAAGWRYFSDELVVLDVDSGGVAPFPLPMSIKPGSVEVLRPHYPELESARLWNRVDGQQVRYLLPPASALPGSPDMQALPSVLIFPRYTPQGGTRLEQIGKVAALQRLAVTGSSNRTLRAADIKAMIDLVERCPAYALVFDDAEEAVKVMSSRILSL